MTRLALPASLPALVTLDAASHVYTHADGHRPPSVTTILGAVPPWAGRFALVPPAVLERKREIGTQVHLATQFDDEGALDESSVSPVLAPYIDAWRRFRAEKRFRVVLAESAIYNGTHDYAGTLDRAGYDDDPTRPPIVLDIKTGDGSGAGPQTAAYAAALTLATGIPVFRRWTVQLHDTGKYTITPHDTTPTAREDWRVFEAALTLWRFARHVR